MKVLSLAAMFIFYASYEASAVTYYTVANGNWTGSIWSTSPNGTGGTLPTLLTNDVLEIDDQVTISSGPITITPLVIINLKTTSTSNIAKIIFTTGGKLILSASGSVVNLSNTTGDSSKNPVVDGTGSGGSNLIEIGGNEVWRASNGDVTGVGQLNRNSSNGVLPVELTRFEVIEVPASVELLWSTASQLNFSHFEIERSADAVEWSVLHTIEGEGTTNELLTYSYLDEQPMLGKNYYRLRMVDLDQTFEYSPIEQVEVAGDKRISLSPNPAAEGKTTYHLNFVPQSGTITLYDLTGMELYKARASEESSEIALPPTITAGTYFVRYTDASVSVVARLLVR